MGTDRVSRNRLKKFFCVDLTLNIAEPFLILSAPGFQVPKLIFLKTYCCTTFFIATI